MGRGERGRRPAGTPAPTLETQDRKAGRAIERFHFAFLEAALGQKQVKPSDFALKGGGNLRLFLKSKRRSRDLDLDHLGRDFEGFGDRIQSVLEGTALAALLRVHGITISKLSCPKNTDTVKRWKLSLTATGMEEAPTKIEFSNRGTDAEPVVEQCDSDLAVRVGGHVVVLAHYPAVHAIEQKVRTLAQRTETQPRDVWDLDHLFRAFPQDFARADLDASDMRKAVTRVWELTFEDYQKLVVDYLEEDIVELYDNEAAWERIQLSVVSQLEQRLKDMGELP